MFCECVWWGCARILALCERGVGGYSPHRPTGGGQNGVSVSPSFPIRHRAQSASSSSLAIATIIRYNNHLYVGRLSRPTR